MTTTTTHAAEAEALSRQFAASWPTPNVLRGVALAESGRITWVQLAAVLAKSYGAAQAEVAA